MWCGGKRGTIAYFSDSSDGEPSAPEELPVENCPQVPLRIKLVSVYTSVHKAFLPGLWGIVSLKKDDEGSLKPGQTIAGDEEA